MNSRRWAGLWALGMVGIACSSSEFKPSPGLTTDGGAGASADAGGDAGALCSKDDTCDDGKACNGKETCAGGHCQAGTSPCANADPTNCDVVCSESTAGPQCGIAAKDEDGDGHGTVACAESPGDDCDDGDKSVAPGAIEQCDGVDSDCDGKLDIDDGFSLGGAEFDVATLGDPEWPHAVWSPTANGWGVVWQDLRDPTGDLEVFFALVDATGQVSNHVRLTMTALDSTNPRIAWGHDSFAVVWNDKKGGVDEVYLQMLDASGTLKGGTVPITSPPNDDFAPDIAATPGGFIVSYTEAGSGGASNVWVQLLTKTGTLDGVPKSLTTVGSNVVGRLATMTNGDLAVGYLSSDVPGTKSTLAVTRLSQFLDVLGGEIMFTVNAPPKVTPYHAIGAVGDGYGSLFEVEAPGNHHRYVERKFDGSAVCGPIELTDVVETSAGVVAWVSALVDTKYGPLGLSIDGASSGKMLLLRPGCTANKALPLTTAVAGRPIGALAKGGGKILALWDAQSGSKLVLKGRVMGEELCN